MPDVVAQKATAPVESLRYVRAVNGATDGGKGSLLTEQAQQAAHQGGAHAVAAMAGEHLEPLQGTLANLPVEFGDPQRHRGASGRLYHRHPQVGMKDRRLCPGDHLSGIGHGAAVAGADERRHDASLPGHLHGRKGIPARQASAAGVGEIVQEPEVAFADHARAVEPAQIALVKDCRLIGLPGERVGWLRLIEGAQQRIGLQDETLETAVQAVQCGPQIRRLPDLPERGRLRAARIL
jgi:hypothetical protein